MPPIPFPTPMVGLAASPKSRGDEGKLSGALQKIVRGGLHLPPRSRRADQGNGHHRHERAALADHPRAAQAPRQGRGGDPRAENPLPRDDPGQRRGDVPPQEADRRPRPVRRGPHPHVPAAQGREHRGVGHQGTLPLDEGTPLRRGEQLPLDRLGRRRHDPQQLHAGRGKGLPRPARARRDRRLQGAERLRRGLLRQAPPGRQLGAGVQDGRLDGLPQRVPAGQAGAAGADRADRGHRAQRPTWATSTATCRAAAAACWAWTRPAATCRP